ncbi:MAG TPA: alanine dehydrogenase [Hyphomicrobiales bacterium]|nr:alanine dehydrogenase [Hyphomicrobiales bacterium]
MLVGVPCEIKDNEYRAAMVPDSVRELVRHGHQVLIQSGLGAGIGVDDDAYRAVGATVAAQAAAIYAQADMIVKVKEPQAEELPLLRPGQLLFAYLHLAPDAELTRGLMAREVTAIAYETVTAPDGSLPLLAPMSEVAGRLAVQAGASCLERARGGAGILLGGVTGVEAARVLVIGGGGVGQNAARIALGMGARVTVLDRSLQRLRELGSHYEGRINCVFSNDANIERYALEADLIIGAVLVPGSAAPKLLSRDIISRMKRGSVLVDVAIDQGGCFETSRPTTHSNPTFVLDGVVHYCVTNMPGSVPRTSTFALNNATLPYILRLADLGWAEALRTDVGFRQGLNLYRGQVCHPAVAQAHRLPYTPAEDVLSEG